MPSGYGEPPLIVAIRQRKYSMAGLMLEQAEINVNVSDLFRRHPLILAMEHRNSILIDQILSHRSFRVNSSFNPLSVAFRYRIDYKLIMKMINIGYVCPEDQKENFLLLQSNMISSEDLIFILEQSSYPLNHNNPPFRLEQLCRLKIRLHFFQRHSYPIIWHNVDKRFGERLPDCMKHFICDLSLR
ncbi:hypothetical protein BLA29_006883 [Euroglyphus maynei]|uniref:SOCS box domain-containing protein n=1 Tax=Euroglyphus maynei TaxID=6958 RepID=A0A1Y3BN80_EURMA|nr:hypothetical protein BLA29_006883 [Euroglyphus maynei]